MTAIPPPTSAFAVAKRPWTGRASLTRSFLAAAALTRLYTVAPLALLCYGLGIATGSPVARAIAAAAAIACALAGGYAYNDLRDQAADRINRASRPLVGGLVAEREAGRLVWLLFGTAVLLAAITASAATITFIVLLIVSARLYSDRIKPVPGIKNAFVGVWSGFLPWGAALDGVPMATLLPAALVVALFVTQKELVADVYDRDGDAAAGVMTIPLALGPRIALVLVAAFNVALFALSQRTAADPFLEHLSAAAEMVAVVNALSLCLVLLKVTRATVRAYLELQKVFLIGGCIALFALILA